MHSVFVLAHGSLGGWDEMVFITIAAIFLIMMGISWVRSRNSTPEVLEETAETSAASTTNDEHFKLD